jgi:hypothetical protein
MLLKHRPPGIESQPATLRGGFEHLDQNSVSILRWLNANKVDYVLVGPVARRIRGDLDAKGAVAIVPAPYGRNFERLANALVAEHAGLRAEVGPRGVAPAPAAIPVKLTSDKLARGRRWMLRFREYDLDIEADRGQGDPEASQRGSEARGPGYQELLYEAGRFELADGVSVEVASPEDLEHYSHVRRTGSAPEFRIMRKAADAAEHEPA